MLISIAACADQNGKDDPDSPDFEEGIPTEVRITLSARSANAQTRADGSPKDPVDSVEFIHDWWIAFVDNYSKPNLNVTILERKDAQEKVSSITSGSTEANAGGGFEVETFKTIIPSGNYRIYAFANIPVKSADEIKKWLEKDNDDGTYKFKSKYISHFVADNPENYKKDPKFGRDVMLWSKDNKIPMSGQMDRQIRNTVEEAFSIEVIRAVAKVEFSFSNPSADEIVLNKLEIDSITSSEQISIVPNYKAVGLGPNSQLANKTRKRLTFNLAETLATSKGSHVLDFYCKETLPYDSCFDIKLNVTRNGEDKEYTYQTKTITYINRNDWIHIPIKFNDWIIYWKLHYYPPIGGYPPVFKQNADGSSMSATLTTGGEFELYPYKIKKNSEDADYYNDVDWDNVEISPLTDAEKNLFITGKTPTVIVNPNYNVTGHPLKDLPKIIAGEFKPTAEGSVEVKLIFYLKNTDNKYQDFPYADTKFTCTFTITRQNESLTPPTPSDP